MAYQGKQIRSWAEVDSITRQIYVQGRYLFAAGQATTTIYVIDKLTGKTVDSYASPSTFPGGIWVDQRYVYHSDWGTNLLYLIDRRTGTVIRTVALGTSVSIAIVKFKRAQMFVVTGAVEPNPASLISSLTGAVAINPSRQMRRGAAFDGRNLWVKNIGANQVSQFTLASGIKFIRNIADPGNTQGIARDGKYLWLLDYTANLYYQTY